ncbi:MAG: Rrf2 family transcriptional regulator [Nitrospira sp.]|nr:Rrf2 family transcriptional regulator [Candidatus Manganitrophaceae bacterium]HIL35774.1 Rrf2 family transcriptional regulator [Candidatus Manganitrophaceae bacterium]
MLKLTKKIDYALMAINFMSFKGESVANTRNIAEIYNIPLEILAKVLQRLAKKGFIISQNGPKGGYTLAKDPSLISLGDLIRAIEGPIQIVHCVEGDTSCSQTARCTIRSPLRKIEHKIVDYLDNVSIDQICSEEVPVELTV